jgi:hypothetical protein
MPYVVCFARYRSNHVRRCARSGGQPKRKTFAGSIAILRRSKSGGFGSRVSFALFRRKDGSKLTIMRSVRKLVEADYYGAMANTFTAFENVNFHVEN